MPTDEFLFLGGPLNGHVRAVHYEGNGVVEAEALPSINWSGVPPHRRTKEKFRYVKRVWNYDCRKFPAMCIDSMNEGDAFACLFALAMKAGPHPLPEQPPPVWAPKAKT